MSDSNDKTSEIQEELGEDDTLGMNEDSDDDFLLTLDEDEE